MLELANKLLDLVQDNVLIGVIRDAVSGLNMVIESRINGEMVIKKAKVTTTTPGFSVQLDVLYEGKFAPSGFHHLTKEGDLAEFVWREFGQDVAKLLVFCDANPAMKADMMR